MSLYTYHPTTATLRARATGFGPPGQQGRVLGCPVSSLQTTEGAVHLSAGVASKGPSNAVLDGPAVDDERQAAPAQRGPHYIISTNASVHTLSQELPNIKCLLLPSILLALGLHLVLVITCQSWLFPSY